MEQKKVEPEFPIIDRSKRTFIFNGCSDAQVSYGGHDDPRKKLIVGRGYDVEYTEMHEWKTHVKLLGIDGKFNIVCFSLLPTNDKMPVEPEKTDVPNSAHSYTEGADVPKKKGRSIFEAAKKIVEQERVTVTIAEMNEFRKERGLPLITDWISVKDKMPTGDVLLLTYSKMIIIGDRYDGGWRTHRSRWDNGKLVHAFTDDEITHWQPLPTIDI